MEPNFQIMNNMLYNTACGMLLFGLFDMLFCHFLPLLHTKFTSPVFIAFRTTVYVALNRTKF